MACRSGASLLVTPRRDARGAHVVRQGGPTMQAEYDGRQVVGIDLHRRRSVIVRMTETGEPLDSVRIANDPMTLAAEIAKAGEHPQVVLEATYGWYWAADVLADAGARVHLAHPLGVKGFAYRRGETGLAWASPPAAPSSAGGAAGAGGS